MSRPLLSQLLIDHTLQYPAPPTGSVYPTHSPQSQPHPLGRSLMPHSPNAPSTSAGPLCCQGRPGHHSSETVLGMILIKKQLVSVGSKIHTNTGTKYTTSVTNNFTASFTFTLEQFQQDAPLGLSCSRHCSYPPEILSFFFFFCMCPS